MTDEHPSASTPRPRPLPREVVLLGGVILVLLAAAVAYRGWLIARAPHELERQSYRRAVPATGPYSEEELAAAARRALTARLRAGATEPVEREDIIRAAEGERRAEDVRAQVFQHRTQRLLDAARPRVVLGWGLMALGAMLAVLFVILAVVLARGPEPDDDAPGAARGP